MRNQQSRTGHTPVVPPTSSDHRVVHEEDLEAKSPREGVLDLRRTDGHVPEPRSVFGADHSVVAAVRKLRYLEGALRLAHQVVDDFHREREWVLQDDGVDTGYFIDWRGIQRYLSPEVILVLRTDPRARGRERPNFDEHPWRVIVPSLDTVLDCTKSTWSANIQALVSQEQRDEVADALNALMSTASGLDSSKKTNAMRLIASIRRLLTAD